MKTLILFLSCLVFIVLTQTQPPLWPEQFEQDFTEAMIYSPLQLETKTQGTFYYDYTNRRYRIDRDSGMGDRFCGSTNDFADTPCSHIVRDGKRYLYFPALNDCCYCCDDVHGCGLVRPNWAEDATYIQNIIDSNGREQEVWNKVGGQNNFIFVTSDTRIITQIDQQPEDVQYFSEDSFYRGIRNASVFDLPAQCTASKTCPVQAICSHLRG